MFNAIRKNGAILAIFACITTGIVALTNYLTTGQIKAQEKAQLLSILNQVVPKHLHDNPLANTCTYVTNQALLGTTDAMPAYIGTLDGKPSAVAIESIAPDGYSGAIKIIVGINYQGVITGTRVLSQQETPGLGDKIDIRVTDWILGFTGKQVTKENYDTWKVRKDGGEFDQFTGATITPRAVVKAVRNTVEYVNQHRDELYSAAHHCEVK
ncbi:MULTISPECIES: electron transport complex subunit RsxG [Vibrio]|uniref:Ion-translocating oxidoreductase complex subunit G n=2 Tax=Vibrio TaxID=662 RepID=A0A7X4LK58_9VIBR|nr:MULTISPECIES: electron transport complex subunit RsxG [Vibrio]MBF8999839.1 electron transport complex subunit RsxG [Vibrio nitrifigilis]MZI93422.1 electron transport complex subunit RsxG [Vibrio eleionomae]